MHILQIEDDIDWFNRIVHPALTQAGANQVYHAENHDKALQLLEKECIDYVIVDLAIPLNDESPTPDITNGLNIAAHIREYYAGIPMLILTGQSTEEAIDRFIEDLPVTTFWDGTPKHIVKVKKKRQLDKVIEALSSAINELNAINTIELVVNGCELDIHEKRVIQLFCKYNNAIGAEINAISEGLSSAKVLRISLINGTGATFHHALAKIDSHKNIDVEDNNYASRISRLPVGSFPTLLDNYYAGCGSRKGIFFQFATDYQSDYFDLLTKSENDTIEVLARLKTILNHWIQNREIKQLSVKEIREKLCSDTKFEAIKQDLSGIEDVDIESFEVNQISTYCCTQHSDLHGKNILVSADKYPIIIDYGDVAEQSSDIDIATLELSQYFHPSIREQFSPPIELFENWFNDDYYLENSPTPKASKFLREWKSESSLMKRQYIVSVYSYAVRQLTYDGTNKCYAKALIKAAINNF